MNCLSGLTVFLLAIKKSCSTLLSQREICCGYQRFHLHLGPSELFNNQFPSVCKIEKKLF